MIGREESPPGAPELPRRFDRVSAAMALVTAIALASTLWLKFGPAPPAEPPGVGTPAPPLRLLDPATSPERSDDHPLRPSVIM